MMIGLSTNSPTGRHFFKAAFSLVELSIVLVILGLLVGGILGGKSLIRAAELRSVSTQYQNYIAAMNGFRDKYFALPGDMTNATQFWGSNGTTTTCAFTNSTDQKTCDGDGDGQLYNSSCVGPNRRAEPTRAWQHLANAGMIEGIYNGVTSTPASKLSPAVWYVGTLGEVSGDSAMFDGNYGTALQLSLREFLSFPCSSTLAPTGSYGVLTASELWNIDTKIDDGKPATGKLVVQSPNGLEICTSTSDSTDKTATYLLSGSDKNCGAAFTNAVR